MIRKRVHVNRLRMGWWGFAAGIEGSVPGLPVQYRAELFVQVGRSRVSVMFGYRYAEPEPEPVLVPLGLSLVPVTGYREPSAN